MSAVAALEPEEPEENEEIEPSRTGMSAELQALVVQHAPLGQSIAAQIWRQAPQAMELNELISLAYMGLVDAASRWESYCAKNGYDPKRVEYFTPFATRRMRGAIFDSLRRADWATRSQRTKAKQLQEAGHDQGASEEELAEKTGLTAEEIRSTLAGLSRKPVSIDAEAIDYEAHVNVEQSAQEKSMLLAMTACVRELPAAQQCVLALHYYVGVELQQAAQMMQITESRASHLHTDAVLAVHSSLMSAMEDHS